MPATSKNVLFPFHNHLLTTGADDPTLKIIALGGAQAIIKVSGHQYRCSAGGYDLERGHFLEVASMVVTWSMVAFFLRSGFWDIQTPATATGQHLDQCARPGRETPVS